MPGDPGLLPTDKPTLAQWLTGLEQVLRESPAADRPMLLALFEQRARQDGSLGRMRALKAYKIKNGLAQP
jgi:hypothetical protein